MWHHASLSDCTNHPVYLVHDAAKQQCKLTSSYQKTRITSHCSHLKSKTKKTNTQNMYTTCSQTKKPNQSTKQLIDKKKERQIETEREKQKGRELEREREGERGTKERERQIEAERGREIEREAERDSNATQPTQIPGKLGGERKTEKNKQTQNLPQTGPNPFKKKMSRKGCYTPKT